MPLKTVYVRKSRPSALALLLALMLTMLFVYAVKRSADTDAAEQASAQAHMQAEIRIDAFSAQFLIYTQTEDDFSARIEAANCAEKGGAGCIIAEGDRWYVISDVAKASEPDTLNLSADGFSMSISGRADQVGAVQAGIDLLQNIAAESIEGDGSVLIDVYQTQAKRICAILKDVEAAKPIYEAVVRTLDCMDSENLRLLHTAANLEWLELMQELCGG